MSSAQRLRQDVSAFEALIATPGNLVAGFQLPANADCYVSTSSALVATTKLLDCGDRELGGKIASADHKHNVGWLEKGKTVIKHAGAPGTVSLYVRDGAGKLHRIG